MTNTNEIKANRSRKISSNMVFCIRKVKNQKKWTREEDELLIRLAEKYNEKHWKEISKKFAKKNSLQCFSRYKRIRPGIVKGSWKKEEDHAIVELVNIYGKAWSKISKLLGTRNGKQIRDRFINVLDPDIKKGKFTDEEDTKLIKLYNQFGSKWATISKYYPDRTADMVKNRFHSSIKKKISQDGEDSNMIYNNFNSSSESAVNSQYKTSSEFNEINFQLNLSAYTPREMISREISETIRETYKSDLNETSSRNFNSTSLIDNSENKNSNFCREASNCFNGSLLFNKETKIEDPCYSSSILDFNLEDFFTY